MLEINVRVNANNFTRRIESAAKFSAGQMREIGQYAIEVMKERDARGVNIFDQPMKPLGAKYADRKRREGKNPIRNVRFSGNLLGSIDVIEANDSSVKVSVKGATPYRKGIFNQNIDPWFGLSEHDATRILDKAQTILGENIRSFG